MEIKKHYSIIEEKVYNYLQKWQPLHEALCQLTQSELYTLLLPVLEAKTDKKRYSTLLQDTKNSAFTDSSCISQADFLAFDKICIDSIDPKYAAIELSPVAILWSNRITWTSQNKILSSIRWLELIWDWCIQLAYHHASGENKNNNLNYITSHRIFRNQNFGNSQYTNHFRMLCLGSHINTSNVFAHVDKMIEQIEQIVNFLKELKNQKIISYDTIIIEFWNLKHFEKLSLIERQEIVKGLQNSKMNERKNIYSSDLWNEHKTVDFLENTVWEVFELLKYSLSKSYLHATEWVDCCVNKNRLSWIWHYISYCYSIFLEKDGKRCWVTDWGITDWTWKLLSNNKTAFVVSWVWTEMILKLFKS